jgi:hypothetical protein
VKNGAHPVFEAKSIHQSIIASVEYNVKDCYIILQNESPLVLVDAENGSKWNGGSELTKNRETRSAKITGYSAGRIGCCEFEVRVHVGQRRSVKVADIKPMRNRDGGRGVCNRRTVFKFASL